MCSRVRCRACGRATWAGCGAHIEQALRGVPESERCQCRSKTTRAAVSVPANDKKPWWKVFR